MTKNIHLTYFRLHDAAEAALLCHWVDSPTLRQMKLKTLRTNVIAALAHSGIGEDAEELLQDMIENAIADSIDVDWTPAMGAAAVMEALFNFGEEK